VEFRGGDDTVLRADDPAKYTVELGANGFVSVRLDCNRGRGSKSSSHLERPLALTRAACPAPLTDRLARDWTYALVCDEGRPPFLLAMADGGIYELEPMSAGAQAGPPGGTEWRLTRLASSPHLLFDPATRRVSGFTGCNRLSGGYTVEGDRLTFGPMATTRMACPEGMATEAASSRH
jgi:heat shock protein HslJ